MDDLHLRPLRPADVADLWDMPADLPLLGLVGEVDGRMVGLGGVALIDGNSWGFFKLMDEAWRRPFLLHRLARNFLGLMGGTVRHDVFTTCDRAQHNAERWLLRLGFRTLDLADHPELEHAINLIGVKEIWQWQHSRS